jgi:hypothetical protein
VKARLPGQGLRQIDLAYLRPNEKRPPALLLSAGSLPTSVNDETREEPPASLAAMQTTRSTNAVMMAGCVSLPLAPRYHASILSSHSQHSPPCAEATISSMDALKSRYGSADSSDTATPPPNADDVSSSSSASPAWFVAAPLRLRATAGDDDGAGFFSRMELEVARGSKRRRSERSPRTMASAAAEASSDSVDGLSDARSSAWRVVVVRADELAKEDSAEESPRKMDAIVLAAADGARNDCVLGCLHEGHIHAAGGDGGGVSWAEFVVYKRELNAGGSPLAIGVGFDANGARRREVTRL